MKIDVDKLKLAKLKFYDNERRGIEFTDTNAYVFLIDSDGKYLNFFGSMGDDIPVFKRAHSSNVLSNGESFGTRVSIVSGKLKTGPCYLIENVDLKGVLKTDYITKEDLESYIISSKRFFVDRLSILDGKKKSLLMRLQLYETIHSDKLKHEELDEFFSERMPVYQYRKK